MYKTSHPEISKRLAKLIKKKLYVSSWILERWDISYINILFLGLLRKFWKIFKDFRCVEEESGKFETKFFYPTGFLKMLGKHWVNFKDI